MTKESVSDIEVEGTQGDGGGTRFRVKVCMKQFFSDERANAYVCVRERHRVRWLQRRLRALFALPPHFLLLSRGHLLPPDEPLAVLERDDTVDVIPGRVDVHAVNHQATAGDSDFTCHTVASAPESGVGDSDTTMREEAHILNTGAAHHEPDDEIDSSIALDTLNDDNDLSERKRQALAILEQFCGEPEEAPRVARTRRRRVRRRRRVVPLPDLTEDIAPAPKDCTSAPSSSPESQPEPARGMSVLRNGCQRPRAPRVIRPLDDEL